MDQTLKKVAMDTVEKIYRKIRKAKTTEFHKFGVNIGIGADGTPTKYIDKLAEDVAINFIKKSEIPVNILTEEAGFLDFGGTYTFVLDPIDGTRNACRGIPFYSISLAVGRSTLSDVEYGIVKNIPTGDVFIAEKGRGTYLNNNHIFAPDCPHNEVLSSLMLGKNTNDFIFPFVTKDNVRSLGAASLEMCMVARGALDFYIAGNEYLRVTDIAASTLIVKEAGGVVANIHGETFDMPLTLEERTSVIAACNETVIKTILAL